MLLRYWQLIYSINCLLWTYFEDFCCQWCGRLSVVFSLLLVITCRYLRLPVPICFVAAGSLCHCLTTFSRTIDEDVTIQMTISLVLFREFLQHLKRQKDDQLFKLQKVKTTLSPSNHFLGDKLSSRIFIHFLKKFS
jgi:hypothetical protein